MLEQLRINKYPMVILDHKNEYGGLPKTPILYASQTNAALLVRELKNTNASCVVFMKDLTLRKKRAWIKKFLLECQRESRDIPIMIVIEELRLYAPQKSSPICKEAILDLAQGGRSEGYGCLLISQRCAEVDNNVLGSLTDLYIMRHYLPRDLDYLKDFLSKGEVAKLPAFKKGQAYHLNLDQSTMTEVQFEDNPRKKAGGTPTPTQVEPTTMNIKGQKRKESKDPKWIAIALVVGAVIVFTIIGIIMFLMLRKEEGEE